jgi:nitrate/TMAO reductase-like tetraheme cytochrome c subunit
MKHRILWSVFLAVLLALGGSLAGTCEALAGAGIGKDGTIGAKKGKAKTIAQLAAMFDSSSCVECHQEAHDEWLKSNHARSIFSNGRTAATFGTTVVNGLMEWPYSGVKGPGDVTVEHLMGCAKCHLPQLEYATDDVAREIIASVFSWQKALGAGDQATAKKEEDKLKSLNINCLTCHNQMAITHKWTFGYPQAGVVYGSMEGDHPSDKFPKMAKSPIMSESILCGQCHGLGPSLELDNPTQCATAYGSYLWAYVAEGGRETCQDCHMKKSGLGHNMQSYRDPGMAKAALDFHVEAFPSNWRNGAKVQPRAVVKVEMINRTGHGLPDG